MYPRWKGKEAKAKALSDPMSEIITQLKLSLIESEATGHISSCSVLLALEPKPADLLNRAYFGRLVVTAEKEKQWFQLGMEEAFYLSYALKCIRLVDEHDSVKTDIEVWCYFKDKKPSFPIFYKAYSYFRLRNWVLRPGSQYGVDFVAYRHHPMFVHSEFAVLVLSDGDGEVNGRLRVWTDVHCTVRLCGSVAKTLLALHVNKKGAGEASPSCLENYSVETRTITRWSPEQCREDQTAEHNVTKKSDN